MISIPTLGRVFFCILHPKRDKLFSWESLNVNFKKYSSLAEAFKMWRLEHNYTTIVAAEISKISRTTIHHIESGNRMTWPVLEKVAVIFNTTPGQIYDHFYWNNKKDQ